MYPDAQQTVEVTATAVLKFIAVFTVPRINGKEELIAKEPLLVVAI